MRVKYLLLVIFIAAHAMAFARARSYSCAAINQAQKGSASKTTNIEPEENDYDVQYLKFNLSLTNTSTAVSGDVTTRARVVAASMSVYTFELNKLITIDSIHFNSQLVTATVIGNFRKVILPSVLNNGDVFTTQVFYHGQPPAGNGQFFVGGLNPVTASGNFKLMYSLSDKDLASDWWPAKQSIQDKIDSVDMLVTVDDNLKVGSNGLLIKTVPLSSNLLRYEWKTKYPIDYYLISVAVAPYNEYSYYMHFTDGSNDSMLVQNYYYNQPSTLTSSQKAALDSTGLIIDHFSNLFGRYPFYKEKYGHCLSELGGGMEHQTMTTIGKGAFSDVTLISHELGHQWWGDHVTYASWQDIWMSEGFASYCEQLFVEHFRGTTAAFNYRKDVFNAALANTGSVYVDDTNNVNRIFSTALTYKKGAAVAHMLRYLAPADSLYFKVLRTYQSRYAMGSAYTQDIKAIAEQVYGTKLDSFFSQWVYGQGYPVYNVSWYQQGSNVVIQIAQSNTAPSYVPCFWMPVQIKLKSANGDKMITLYNNAKTQTFFTSWDNMVTGLELDPDLNILHKGFAPKQDIAVLNIKDADWSNVEVYPNPANAEWHVNNLPANSQCSLTDITGKVLWQKDCSYQAEVPAAALAKGTYTLMLRAEGKATKCIQLVR